MNKKTQHTKIYGLQLKQMPKRGFIAVNTCGTKVLQSIASPSALKHWKKNSKLTLKQVEGGK